MKLVDATIEGQAHQALKNLEAILVAAGSSLDHVLKCTVYLADINDFQVFNGVYGQYFGAKEGSGKPARSCFQVAALPANARVEIEAIAIKKNTK